MNRQEALSSIKANVENEDMIKHMLAVEAIMKALAIHLDEDENEWALAGLLHDIDIELTEGDILIHGKLGADLVKDLGASEAVAHAILCHDEGQGMLCENMLDWALFCADRLTHLITAAVQLKPDMKIADLNAESVKKRLGEKSFAPEVNREQLARCSELGLELEEFMGIGLVAMQEISDIPGPLKD